MECYFFVQERNVVFK